jgi:hypothetical protein
MMHFRRAHHIAAVTAARGTLVLDGPSRGGGTRLKGSSLGALVAAVAAAIAFACLFDAGVASAATQRSSQVAIVLGEGTEDAGTLPTYGSVAGDEQESFEQFNFTYLSQEEIDGATLAAYDTVVLNEVFTQSLTEGQKRALSGFVTSGGKLIIHDSDGTEGNSYSWLPVPAESGPSCENCGNTDGEATIVENNTIVSSEPSSPYYVAVNELPENSDAVGDANVLLTNDPRWSADIRATNDQNVEGAVDAYAQDGGLILYNGFDTDYIESTFESGVAWLQKIWYAELNQQWDPDNLPHSNPVVGSSGHCGHATMKVGVVTVCADQVTGSPEETVATGNVVLDGAVAVGEGPLTIDQETKQLTLAAPAPISIVRGEGSIQVGEAAFTIEAAAATDPVSGKGNLAKVSLTGANLGALGTLHVGGLPFSLSGGSTATLYLDSEKGGGLVGAASIDLSVLGKPQPSGSLSLGFYASSSHPVVVLGGAVHLGAVGLGNGWKFDGLDLSYQEPSDTWTVSGGLEVPIGSLQASGSVVGGRLESLSVTIGGQELPLGDSGFFFTDFGGGVSGLANGPLKIDASTGGYWGVPKAPVEPFYLDNVTLTVNFGGSVSLDGAVSLALRDHSPVQGQIHLRLKLHPFSATGTFSAHGTLPGVSLHAAGGSGFTVKHFTAALQGSIKVFGLSGSGEVIASDKGLGASGTVCGPFHHFCQTVALAGTWSQIAKLDVPAIIGGEPRKLITVSGVAASGAYGTVRAPHGRRLLLITVTGKSGAPPVELRAPGGRRYKPSRRSRTVVFATQPQFGLATVAVLHPRAGKWRVITATGDRITAQTVGSLSLIKPGRISPQSSSHHRLTREQHVLVSWRSGRMPRGVRIALVARSKPHEAGKGIAGGLPANGRYRIPVSKLPTGRSYIAIAATYHGVPFQQHTFRQQVWRVAPRTRHRGAASHKRHAASRGHGGRAVTG